VMREMNTRSGDVFGLGRATRSAVSGADLKLQNLDRFLLQLPNIFVDLRENGKHAVRPFVLWNIYRNRIVKENRSFERSITSIGYYFVLPF
jgi:hypothetical protein